MHDQEQQLSAREERTEQMNRLLLWIKEETAKRDDAERWIKTMRDELSLILAETGEERYSIPSFATVELSRPSVTVSYDKKEIEAAIHQLVADGLIDYAQMFVAAKKESHRAGSLRITFEKGGKV